MIAIAISKIKDSSSDKIKLAETLPYLVAFGGVLDLVANGVFLNLFPTCVSTLDIRCIAFFLNKAGHMNYPLQPTCDCMIIMMIVQLQNDGGMNRRTAVPSSRCEDVLMNFERLLLRKVFLRTHCV